MKAAESQKQTHFAHYKNASCPTVTINHKPYSILVTLPRDPTLAIAAKEWLLQNIVDAYEKIRKEFKELALTWKEFHKLIETANKLNIWALKDTPHEYIPYLLLLCTDVFEKNNYRKQSCFFVLEPSPEGFGRWNDNGRYKKYIWEIQLPSRSVVNHDIDLNIKPAWYIEVAKSLLK